MRSYCNDGNLIFPWTVVPEYPVCGWSRLLRIGFEDFFLLGSYEAREFMSLKAFVSRILRKKMDANSGLHYG